MGYTKTLADNAQRAYERGYASGAAGEPLVNPWQRRGRAEKAMHGAYAAGWHAGIRTTRPTTGEAGLLAAGVAL